MSKMAELDMQIREMLDDGVAPPTIAKILEVPLGMVYDVLESYPDPDEYDEYNDSMDGDHDSAMASAGFGTDEDYGHYGED
jgi:hypothetical protein